MVWDIIIKINNNILFFLYQRKSHCESRSFAFGGVESRISAVSFGDHFYQIKADAHPHIFHFISVAAAKKRRENMRLIVFGNPYARIGHFQHEPAVILISRESYFSVRPGKDQSIVQKLFYDENKSGAVDRQTFRNIFIKPLKRYIL